METRMRELVDRLNELSRAYYVYDSPLVSDAEYDVLFDTLAAMEKESGLVLPDSPTQRVGGEILRAFAPHTHRERLWSLDKVKSREELLAWTAKMEKACLEEGFPRPHYALEYKFDGLTVNLSYENGLLVQAATRGNGITGEAILPQIKTIRSVPLSIPFKGEMEVQGECFMRLSVLRVYNETNTEPLKNARNAAAGALRNLDPNVTAQRKLDCFFYNVGYIRGASFDNQMQMLDFLRENHFPLSDGISFFEDASALCAAVEAAEKARDGHDFLIDGMVVKATDFALRASLGTTDRFPRWAIAYKFAAQETTTELLDVTWEVGRSGKLTPRAHLAPVELAGATIRHATLNNYDDILRKRVGVGARVFLRRSNEVIPEILGAVEDGSPVRPIEKPRFCPACGAHLEERGAHLFCTNSLSCKPQIVARLSHYASRDAMDIESFSEKTAGLFVDALGLDQIAQLYALDAEKLRSLEGFGEKKAQNLLAAIEKSKTPDLGAFLFAIGIPNVGKKTARDLAAHFGSFQALREASMEALCAVDEVGEVVAQSILDFFADPMIVRQIEALFALGVHPVEQAKPTEDAPLPLRGKTFVVTGTMEALDRRGMEALIASLGGKAAGSVSKKTDGVIAGEGAGSKLDKARALNIPVWSESEFFAMLERENALPDSLR